MKVAGNLIHLAQFKVCAVAGCGRKPFGMHLGREYCRRHLQEQRNTESSFGRSSPDGANLAGFVYFIECAVDKKPGPIKIGLSVRPEIRITDLQPSSPYPLKLLATWRCADMQFVEKQLHRKFKEHWIRGEWFHPAPDLLALIDLIAADKHAEAGQRIL